MPANVALSDGRLRSDVLAALEECLSASGLPMPEVPEGVGLIDRVAGFDSLMAVEATLALEDRLKVKLPGDCIFIEERPNRLPRARTLGEVVNALRSACEAVQR